jgi:hypothetical protein
MFRIPQVSSFLRFIVCYQRLFVNALTLSLRTGKTSPKPLKPSRNHQLMTRSRRPKHYIAQSRSLELQRPLHMHFFSSRPQHHCITCFETLLFRNIPRLHFHNLSFTNVLHLHPHNQLHQPAGVSNQCITPKFKHHSSFAQMNYALWMHMQTLFPSMLTPRRVLRYMPHRLPLGTRHFPAI